MALQALATSRSSTRKRSSNLKSALEPVKCELETTEF
jgi:hypothetical protein